MSKIRLTKEFRFEMAHALHNYDGPCRNIHGHSYRLFITVFGEPIGDEKNPKNGMLMDFGDLKLLINKEIVKLYDHALVVYDRDPRLAEMERVFNNVIKCPYQPTCENLVTDFAIRLAEILPSRVHVHSVKLYETATSFAEWYASDNP